LPFVTARSMKCKTRERERGGSKARRERVRGKREEIASESYYGITT